MGVQETEDYTLKGLRHVAVYSPTCALMTVIFDVFILMSYINPFPPSNNEASV